MANTIPEVSLGGHHPENFIVAVVGDPQQSELLVDELRSMGFSEESIIVLHGKSGADAIRHRGEGNNPIRRIWNRFDEFARDAMDDIQRHIDAAERGSYVFIVVLSDADSNTSDGLRQIIKSHGGSDIVLVGRHSVELLDA